METIKLNTGDDIPVLGLGTWQSPNAEVYEVIRTAIKIGYRHFDCALIYGNESEIGDALVDAIKEGDVFRSELFITSKLWNDSHAPENVEPALRKSLKNLKLDYLDLYLIHWPVATELGSDDKFISLEKLPIKKTWQELERLKGFGLIRNIGVSNFSVCKLEEMKNYVSMMPSVDQVESHPYLSQEKLLGYSKKNNIVITAYGPLALRKRPDGKIVESKPPLVQNPVILKIAQKHNATPVQILIAWQVTRGVVVIPKTASVNRLKENYEAQFIKLDSNDMLEINKLNIHLRYISAKDFESKENGYTEESIWK